MKKNCWLAPVLLLSSVATARPHPQLTPEANVVLAKAALVLPADNLVAPLSGDHRAVALITPKPALVALVADTAVPLLSVDGELYRLAGGKLLRAGGGVGKWASASRDGSVIASLSDAHTLQVERAGKVETVSYRRPVQSQYELLRPWVSPDGKWILATVRDYTQSLDTFAFVVVDAATLTFEEVALTSKNFAPGDLRQSLPGDANHVLVDMWLQENGDDTFTRLKETQPSVFDLKTHRFATPPAGLALGETAPAHPALSWKRGAMIYSDDKHCGGDRTLVYEAGKPLPARLATGLNTDDVVSVIDALPDGSALLVNVLNLKTCKNHGALVPMVGDDRVEKWLPFPLPLRGGPIEGKVVSP